MRAEAIEALRCLHFSFYDLRSSPAVSTVMPWNDLGSSPIRFRSLDCPHLYTLNVRLRFRPAPESAFKVTRTAVGTPGLPLSGGAVLWLSGTADYRYGSESDLPPNLLLQNTGHCAGCVLVNYRRSLWLCVRMSCLRVPPRTQSSWTPATLPRVR